MNSDLKNPTYKQLKEGAKRHLSVTYKLTKEVTLKLSANGAYDIVFAQNELGQATILAEKNELSPGVSSVVIHGWSDN